ncbi:hypothetical protein ACLB2K_026014 [Fragaria x ananassa]
MAMSAVLLLRFLAFATIITINVGSCNGNLGVPACKESEKQALLMFKQDLEDPSNRFSSWVAQGLDCCSWTGVACDKLTGHIRRLHLGFKLLSDSDSPLGGYFHGTGPHQLGNLSSLVYLSLSDLDGLKVENLQCLSSFSRLKHLDLSSVNLSKASRSLVASDEHAPLFG